MTSQGIDREVVSDIGHPLVANPLTLTTGQLKIQVALVALSLSLSLPLGADWNQWARWGP